MRTGNVDFEVETVKQKELLINYKLIFNPVKERLVASGEWRAQ